MTAALEACAWPMRRTGEALDAIADVCGLSMRAGESLPPPPSFASDRAELQTRWLEAAAATRRLEVEAVEAGSSDIERFVRGGAPALLRFPAGGQPCVLALRGARRGIASFVAPDLSVRRVSIATVCAALRHPLEAPLVHETEQLLDEARVKPRRRRRARAAILRERLAASNIGSGWLVRLPAGASVHAQASLAHLWSRGATLVAAHAAAFILWILSWWIVGRAALEGRLDRGWLLAWALLLATVIPFELAVTWLQGRIAIDAGALLKRRLLQGALRLEPDEIRHEGAGQLLGRVIEAQAIEALALGGGFLALVAGLEMLIAAIVLATVSAWLPLPLIACAALGAGFAWRFFGRRWTWSGSRLTMTYDLVERMVGHRTRLAQEAREEWHDREDHILDKYLGDSRAMDRAAVWLMAVTPRAWLLAGVFGLSPLFVSGSASPEKLAVGLGGVLLAYRAFRRLTAGVSHLAGAAIAWSQAAPVFQAAARPSAIGSAAFALRPWPAAGAAGDVLLDGHRLSFRHRGHSQPVLRGCSLRVQRGDRILLQGPSGGGKSTLASLLTGLRVPESGLLLLEGIDRHTLGIDGWRRRVVAVPQFHENHVFMGTFAFNLLMGRQWPPAPADLDRAETVCRELGLGELLARMPSGLFQQVGETGWQLSHGERSRLFIARALLQEADFVVLDESFAQLDPANLHRALGCVLERAPTVMVIAHP